MFVCKAEYVHSFYYTVPLLQLYGISLGSFGSLNSSESAPLLVLNDLLSALGVGDYFTMY